MIERCADARGRRDVGGAVDAMADRGDDRNRMTTTKASDRARSVTVTNACAREVTDGRERRCART